MSVSGGSDIRLVNRSGRMASVLPLVQVLSEATQLRRMRSAASSTAIARVKLVVAALALATLKGLRDGSLLAPEPVALMSPAAPVEGVKP